MAEAIISFKIINSHIHHMPSFKTSRFESKSVRQFSGSRFINGFHQILAHLPIGFAVFFVHLATILITGTGINPPRSLGAAIIYNKDNAWNDHVWSFIGVALVALYH